MTPSQPEKKSVIEETAGGAPLLFILWIQDVNGGSVEDVLGKPSPHLDHQREGFTGSDFSCSLI